MEQVLAIYCSEIRRNARRQGLGGVRREGEGQYFLYRITNKIKKRFLKNDKTE